jgi:hypothetical protein
MPVVHCHAVFMRMSEQYCLWHVLGSYNITRESKCWLGWFPCRPPFPPVFFPLFYYFILENVLYTIVHTGTPYIPTYSLGGGLAFVLFPVGLEYLVS